MIKVSVVPNSPHGLRNQIFSRDLPLSLPWGGNSHWMDVNVTWRERTLAAGLQMDTCDILPVEQADVVIQMDLPGTFHEVLQLKQKAPQAKHILLLMESPFWPYWFEKKNHELYDIVLTYNPLLVDNKKYFHLFLAKSYPPKQSFEPNWEKRKKCVLLNSNIYRGFKTGKTPLSFWQDLLKYRQRGWYFSLADVWRYEAKFLYEQRRQFVRIAHAKGEDNLDVFGNGWDGFKYSWYYRFFPDAPYKNFGILKGDKLDLFRNYKFVFSFENYASNEGYISEKLFDAMYAGSVPIYLGDIHITRYVPSNCFVDARNFSNYAEIVDYMNDCDKNTWLTYLENIQSYFKSAQIKPFLPDYHADFIIQKVKEICDNSI